MRLEISDGRGCRLESWGYDPRGPLRILCPAQALLFAQIQVGLRALNYIVTPTNVETDDGTRSRALEIDRPLNVDAIAYLDMLTHVLFLLGLPPNVRSGIALDFYTTPTEGMEPNQWPKTLPGGLVRRMKYTTPEEGERALEKLARLMTEVIEAHPLYRNSVLVETPGHDSSAVSWSQRLAQAIAQRTGLPVITAKTRTMVRAQSKQGDKSVDLTGEFELPEEAMFQRLLVIDDVYRSGGTMKGMAAAAMRAQAIDVHVLVAARTLKN